MHPAVEVEQLDVTNCSFLENLARCQIQLEIATERNLLHPDFTRLGDAMVGLTTDAGAATLPSFTSWPGSGH